jgi:hypothetical protein
MATQARGMYISLSLCLWSTVAKIKGPAQFRRKESAEVA